MTTESAIPKHLRCPRTLPANTPSPDYQPVVPGYTARFPEHQADLVVAVIGAQHNSQDTSPESVKSSVSRISTFLTSSSAKSNPNPGSASASALPSFHEWASVTDNKGYFNIAAIAYWPSRGEYERWEEESGFRSWWDQLELGNGQQNGVNEKKEKNGWFLEVFFPKMDHFETLFNTDKTPEGAAHMQEGLSGGVREHAYWGSMRDRLPASQVDEMVGEKWVDGEKVKCSADGGGIVKGRVRVPGKKNFVVIRSGQDWSATNPEERKLYLETMHPVLIKGMDFLRDDGLGEVGCYSCRFMDVVGPNAGVAATAKPEEGNQSDRTFGLAYFDDLASLERWCKEHPTHLAIFGGFMRYAEKLQGNVTLKVFHEVMVLEKPEQQIFEYVNCHVGTGMLVSR